MKKIISLLCAGFIAASTIFNIISVNSYASGYDHSGQWYSKDNNIWQNINNFIGEASDRFLESITGPIVSVNVDKSPNLNYYNNAQTNSTTVDNRVYTSYVYNGGSTTNKTMYYKQNNLTYTYNPVTNNYSTYDYYYTTDDRDTYYYEDNNYIYATTNNITNITYYVQNKANPNDCKTYSYYYQLPDGSNSFNLTPSDVYGIYYSYGLYKYDTASDSDTLLGLWHLNGNTDNSVSNSDYDLTYNTYSYYDGRFDGSLLLAADNELNILGEMPDTFTLEFYFFNAVGTSYTALGSYGTWNHIVIVYDDEVYTTYVNGYLVSNPWGSGSLNPTFSDVYTYTDSSTGRKQYIYSATYNLDNINGLSFDVNSDYVTFMSSNSITFPSYFNYTFRSQDPAHTKWAYNPCRYRGFSDPSISGRDILPMFSPITAENCYNNLNPVQGPGGYYANWYLILSDSDLNFPITVQEVNYFVDSQGNNKTFSYNPVNVDGCYIDEIRLSRGKIYGDDLENYVVPNSPFSNGEIFVAPSGNNFLYGDIAIQTTFSLTNSRVGGADYSYPVDGSVYIGLSDTTATSCKVYHNGTWYYCNFAIWNGSKWVDGVGFDFSSQSWQNTNPNININIDIDVDVSTVNGADKETFLDFIQDMEKIFAIVTTFLGALSFISPAFGFISIGVTVLLTLIAIKLLKR